MRDELVRRLIEYTQIDTQSDENSKTCPSTEKQKVLGRKLHEELVSLGLEACMDDYGYVYGKLKGNLDVPAIGFIAHLDTAPGAPASNVKPRIHEQYQGGDIVLENKVVIPASDLKDHIGDTIITSDGTTLLGADDKDGISVNMTALGIIKREFNGNHGDIYVMFNPDEEVGHGTDHFNREKFPVVAAYTLDGGKTGEIECETFHAAKAKIIFKGTPAHPGQAGYQTLINPVSLACEYERAIPAIKRPETTRGRFGFFYPSSIQGNPEEAMLTITLRDFDKTEFERKKDFLTQLAEMYNHSYGVGTVIVEVEDQYQNMKTVLDNFPEVFHIAVDAMKKAGVAEPTFPPIRGGTDGATLTVKYGISTPNIAVGMYNIHSVKEFASLNDMVIATNFVLNVVKAYAEIKK